MPEDEAAAIRDRYRGMVMEWAELADRPGRANRVFDRIHAYVKQIRDTADGRAALRSLLSDPDPAVRLSAGADTLWFSVDEAEPVLQELADGRYGLTAFSARMTLQESRAGRLNLDW